MHSLRGDIFVGVFALRATLTFPDLAPKFTITQ